MFNGGRVSVREHEKVLETGGGDGCKQCERAQCHWIMHVQIVNTVTFYVVYIPPQYKI